MRSFFDFFQLFRRLPYAIAAGAFLFSLDQILKTWLHSRFLNQQPVLLFPHSWLSISLHFNPSAAFGIPLSGWLYYFLFFVVIIVFILAFHRLFRQFPFLFVLLFAGSASNLIDRLLYGSVLDYIDISHFTVFNLADVYILSSVFCLILFQWVYPRRCSSGMENDEE